MQTIEGKLFELLRDDGLVATLRAIVRVMRKEHQHLKMVEVRSDLFDHPNHWHHASQALEALADIFDHSL